jgi:hypothetical protein
MTSRTSTAAPILAALAIVLAAGCAGAPASSPSSSSAVYYEPSQFLAALPVNSDRRCMGIAIVIEAMLGDTGVEAEACLAAHTLADHLYAQAASPDRMKLPQFIEADGVRTPLVSEEGLELLSELIAVRYKRDFERWAADQATADRLVNAETAFVLSAEDLRQILQQDSDRTVGFGGSGIRRFASGDESRTHHAFVLQLQPGGQVVVYDPNDPKLPITCELEDTEDGVIVEWTGEYRDTGMRTTQAYYLAPVRDYLAIAFSL